MLIYLMSFGAGVIVTLSPCILPVLPMILGGSLNEHRLGPWVLALGLMFTFTVLGVSLTAFGHIIGVDHASLRVVGAALMIAFGLVMISDRLQKQFARLITPVANQANRVGQTRRFQGLWGQFALGSLLGVVWSPCIGPTLGAAFGLASTQSTDMIPAAFMMASFSLGTAVPLVGLSYLTRKSISKYRNSWLMTGSIMRVMFGGLIIIFGVLILFGLDRNLESTILQILPKWWTDMLTKF